jgi:hypothetical protein
MLVKPLDKHCSENTEAKEKDYGFACARLESISQRWFPSARAGFDGAMRQSVKSCRPS